VRLEPDIGSLEVGKLADFVLVDSPSVEHWLYHFRPDTVLETRIGGERVYQSAEPDRDR
jgi:imidazolonepropionase